MRRLLPAVVILAAVVLALFAVRRARFGVDVTDESFSVAMPWELHLGNRPFVDEHAAQQTAALLLVPAVAAKGSGEGLVLFMRHLYLALALATAAFCFIALKRFVPVEAALAAALLPVAFIPFSTPALGYNTMGMLLLTIGLMAGAASLRSERPAVFGIVQAVALGLATFAYPSLAVPAAIAVVAAAALQGREDGGLKPAAPRRARAFIGGVIIGGAAFGAVAWLILRHVRFEEVKTSLDYVRAFGVHGRGWSKLPMLAAQVREEMPYRGVLGYLVAGLVVLASAGTRLTRGLALCGLLAALAAAPPRTLTTSHMVVAVAALALLPPILVAMWRSSARLLLLTCCLPAVAAGLVTAFTSSNGLRNAAIGLLPGAVAAVALAVASTSATRLFPLAVCASLALPAALQYNAWRHVYRDDDVAHLDTVIPNGPFAGLRTTAAKARFLDEIGRDVRAAAAGGAKSCVFYDDFPAGYLFSSMRPLAPSVWIPSRKGYPRFDRRRHVDFFAAHLPDAAFELKRIPISSAEEEDIDSTASDPLRHWFWRRGYRIDADRPRYTVYSRCSSCEVRVFDLEDLAPLPPGAQYGVTATRGWTWYEADADGGRAAITNSPGATMSGSIPRFTPGTWEADLSFFSYGPERRNAVTLTLGESFRELAFGPDCSAGFHRFTNVVFRDVASPKLEIRASSIGQQSLILDTLVLRRVDVPRERSAADGCLAAGPQSEVPRVIEAESMSGVLRGDYRLLNLTGWTVYEQPSYAGGAAALTGKQGAELRQRLSGLTAGDYEVTVSAFNYSATAFNEIAVTIGGRGSAGGVLRIGGPGTTPGMVEARLVIRNVKSGPLVLTAAAIGQQSLIVDTVTLRRLSGSSASASVPRAAPTGTSR